MEWIDAVFMRGGTSKGLFFDARDLPADAAERDRIFTRALGSPDPFGRQLDGMGGGTSSLSKIVVVAAADRDGVDVECTFGQVAVDEAVVDYSGNCGNLSSAVVPFALEAGLLSAEDGVTTVVVRNTNTDAVIAVRLHVRGGVAETAGDLVFVRAAEVGLTATETPEDSALAHPKIALVAPPATTTLLDGTVVPADDCDLVARVLSMGVTHKAIPGTSALCAAAAAGIPGTVVQECSASSGRDLRIATPSGVVDSAADVRLDDGVPQAASASLYRTSRPLMRGQVAVPD